jgi:CheY-like chemotaxis protein
MKRILIVEDNQIVACVYRAKLQAEGFGVEVAKDGEVGLEMILRLKPDLVLLDIVLPKLSGIEILKKLCVQEDFQNLPVIIFSSSYVSDEAWQAGANQVLNKASSSPKQVLEGVRNMLVASTYKSPLSAQSPDVAEESPRPVAAETSPRTTCLDADAEFRVGLRKTFLEGAPETSAVLRSAVQGCIKNPIDQTNLFDLYRKVHSMTGNAGLSGLTAVSQMAATLEALIKEVSDRPKANNALVLRTVAQAITFLFTLIESGDENVEGGATAIRVLVVDDEEIARRAISFALEKAGFDTLRVSEPATALKILVENRFDLLFLDIEMPEMNGFELYTKVRGLPLHEKIPAVFMTTQGEYARHVQASTNEGNDLIAKPFPYSEVAVKAQMLLAKAKLKGK